ncbi:MAG: hypothetical protein F6K62_06725 [Sphaerospermopsis sp. SIO1G2]|nr:hypothetical protein [Sphaerospermopsis sp. SIO1G2]
MGRKEFSPQVQGFQALILKYLALFEFKIAYNPLPIKVLYLFIKLYLFPITPSPHHPITPSPHHPIIFTLVLSVLGAIADFVCVLIL